VTRNEPDCLSNVTNLARTRGLEKVYAPGIINSLDYFEHLTSSELMMSYGVPHQALRPGEKVAIGPTRQIEAVATPLKMLSTSWYFEAGTGALFCSDVLTDGSSDRPDGRVVDAPEEMNGLVAQMKEHFTMRYDWLAGSDPRQILRGLEALFGRLDVRLLLPSRGAVIRGKAAVDQRIEALLRAMREVSRVA
jgi:glyoxylase-like metal-dependent hydrolase (beta-lactamase superfamily II)